MILSLIVTFSGIGGWLVGALWLYAIISEHLNPAPSYSSPGGTISLPSAGEFALGACMMCPALLGSVIAIPGGLWLWNAYRRARTPEMRLLAWFSVAGGCLFWLSFGLGMLIG